MSDEEMGEECLECERSLLPSIDSTVAVKFDTGFGHRNELRGDYQYFCTEECLIAFLLREYHVTEYGPRRVNS